MAGDNRSNISPVAPGVRYMQLPWGDLIYGTKEQLQGLGIAVGMQFPGEPNGPRRRLRVTDPRGFGAKVEAAGYRGEGIFSASIPFPGRDRPDYISDFASGVRKREAYWGDIFTGTAESLIAAGLVRQDQFPGQPGMRKVTVTILPDGSLPTGAPTANCREAHEPGSIRISKKSKAIYDVSVTASHDEQNRRHDEQSRNEREWEARMMALPRPARLDMTARQTPKYRVEGNVIYLTRNPQN